MQPGKVTWYDAREAHPQRSEYRFYYQNNPALELASEGDSLAVKTTCKDRWRQVLAEANKIPKKHLFTIQPRISSNQTNEMTKSNLQLVIPESIHSTYTEDQRKWLWDLETFVKYIAEKQ